MSSPLEQFSEVLRSTRGLPAGALKQPAQADLDDARSAQRGFAGEAVREGYLLHYGQARILESDDTDLALLAGDQCYAIGLIDLAERGDLPGIRVLAGIIGGAAQAHAAGNRAAAEALWATKFTVQEAGRT